MSPTHLSEDQILALAGDPDTDTPRAHLRDCAECRERVARIRGLLEGAAEEVFVSRPGCPPAEEVVALPRGAEQDHPHVRSCPLCREELTVWRALESVENFGTELDLPGPILATAGTAPVYRGEGPEVRVRLEPDATASGELSGARVEIRVVEEEVVVTVHGTPERPLSLRLSDEVLERELPVREGETRAPLASWQWATVEEKDGADPEAMD